FVRPSDWEAVVKAKHEALAAVLAGYYDASTRASSFWSNFVLALGQEYGFVGDDVVLDAKVEKDSLFEDARKVVDDLAEWGFPKDAMKMYFRALGSALRADVQNLEALIAKCTILEPDFDPLRGKFHLGVYWLVAAPFFMWAAPAL